MQQRVLFIGVLGNAKFARAGRIDKFDLDAVAHALQITVEPDLEGIGRGVAATLLDGPLVGAAGRVRFDLVGRAESDIDAPPIGLPARDAGSVMLVGIGDATIIFFAILILGRVGIRISAQPELLDKLLALLV